MFGHPFRPLRNLFAGVGRGAAQLPLELVQAEHFNVRVLGFRQAACPGHQRLLCFAWSAARLFVEQSVALGGRLDRASLVDSLRKVNAWTANDLHSRQVVGPKQTGECWRFIQVKGGSWVPVGGSKYTCNGITTVR